MIHCFIFEFIYSKESRPAGVLIAVALSFHSSLLSYWFHEELSGETRMQTTTGQLSVESPELPEKNGGFEGNNGVDFGE